MTEEVQLLFFTYICPHKNFASVLVHYAFQLAPLELKHEEDIAV